MKIKSNPDGIVYSTNPDFVFEEEIPISTLEPAKQQLKIQLDRKQRGGKQVTLVTGFEGSPFDLATLGKTLKTACSVGGSVKDNTIILQGDFRDKVLELLLKKGYVKTKKI